MGVGSGSTHYVNMCLETVSSSSASSICHGRATERGEREQCDEPSSAMPQADAMPENARMRPTPSLGPHLQLKLKTS